MIIEGFFNYPSLHLSECLPTDLTPVFEIDRGYMSKQTIYRYNRKLWVEKENWSVQKLTSKVQLGLFSEPERQNIEANWLVAGEVVYEPAVEPFYWLDTNSSSVNGIVRVSCREDGFLEYRRRFTHREREDAVSCATAIIKLVYNEKRDPTERWLPSVIHVLPAYYEGEVEQQ